MMSWQQWHEEQVRWRAEQQRWDRIMAGVLFACVLVTIGYVVAIAVHTFGEDVGAERLLADVHVPAPVMVRR